MSSRNSIDLGRRETPSSSSSSSGNRSLSRQRLSLLSEASSSSSSFTSNYTNNVSNNNNNFNNLGNTSNNNNNNNMDKNYSASSYTSSTVSSSSSTELPVLSSLSMVKPELLRLNSGDSGGKIRQTWSFRSNGSGSDLKSVSSDSHGGGSHGCGSHGGSSPASSTSSKKGYRVNRGSGRMSGQIQLDPIEVSSTGSGKIRPPSIKTTPINSLYSPGSMKSPISPEHTPTYHNHHSHNNQQSSSSGIYQVTWSDSIKVHEHIPASPTSSESSSIKEDNGSNYGGGNGNGINSSGGGGRLSSYFNFNITGYGSKHSDRSMDTIPNNRLPPMPPSGTSRKSDSPKPRNNSPGRKTKSDPAPMQRISPNTKPRPLSARMSSLISIFSRSESLDSSLGKDSSLSKDLSKDTASTTTASTGTTAVSSSSSSSSSLSTAPPPPPPTSTSREVANSSMAGTSSHRRSESVSRKAESSLNRRKSVGNMETNVLVAGLMVRNLDTGQVIDLDRINRDVPTTIPPQFLFKSPKSKTQGIALGEPAPLPPLFKEIEGSTNTNGYVVRTL